MLRRWNKEPSFDDEATMNLTPLIDVVFVVLITFIVIAPLLEVEQVQLAQGAAQEMQSVQSSPIAIHVRADNSIWLEGRQVHLERLEEQLRQLQSKYPQSIPQLFQDRRATFGSYQQVKVATLHAGFSELELIVEPS